MKHRLVLASFVGLLAMLCASMVAAQDPRLSGVVSDKYVISAKAGGVNFLSGTVTVIRRDGTSGHLVAGESLDIGDRVTTGSDSMAEILLNPGSYLRIGGNTTFEFISTDLEDLKVDLKSGSAIFEIYAADEFRVSVKMPKTEIALTRTGVYRLDVGAEGMAKLEVFKGKAFIGPGGKIDVDSGRTAALVTGGISVMKFDRDTKDPLDIWSKERGKELTKANASLKRNSLYDTLLSSYNHHGWDMYNSFGLWIFSPYRGMWSFLPFGWGWASPYGYGYGFDIWSCRLPQHIYRDPYVPGGTSTGGTLNSGPKIAPIRTVAERRPIPPYIRMNGNGGSSGRTMVDTGSTGSGRVETGGRGRDINPPRNDTPVYRPPVISSPINSAPTKVADSPIKKPI